ncbi:MAG: DUF2617 family protein [Planctomycetota bacterium]
MDVSTVRPKVAQLRFQLLQRSVHPELFQIFKTQRIEREQYSARIDITNDGHVVQWTFGKTTVSEIASSNLQSVPQGRHLLSEPLRKSGLKVVELPGAEYEYSFELQRVKPEMFWMIQKQLKETSETHELIHVFNASGRVDIGGLSFLNLETRSASLQIQAIHTFPDDFALVKTESTLRVVEEHES